VLTADSFGTAGQELRSVPCTVSIISGGNEELGKHEYVIQLGSEHVVCIGNGRNDRLMLEKAALGIAVIQAEGAATEAIRTADVVMTNILDALDLLIMPLRLIATLRS
jgi:soluble P-type ATPase